jgi:hypothetical protein
VQVSLDGATWSAPVATGRGAPGASGIAFAPVPAKFVRLTLTEGRADAPPWALQLLRLYEAGPPGR